MQNLVSTWLNIELNQNGKKLVDILGDMNMALRAKHTHSRIHEWAEYRNGRGGRMPKEVRYYILTKVLKNIINNLSHKHFNDEIDLKPKEVRKLARMLS